MTAGDTRTLVERYVAAFNSDAMDAAGDLVSEDYVQHGAASPVVGIDGFKRRHVWVRTAFPDYKGTIDALIVEGDTAALRYTAKGTHNGPFLGVQPTGKKVSYSGMTFLRIAHGRIVEEWLCFDGLGLIQQLGASRAGG
jgi:steroid delta-isomerase-like uncharacterized protein